MSGLFTFIHPTLSTPFIIPNSGAMSNSSKNCGNGNVAKNSLSVLRTAGLK